MACHTCGVEGAAFLGISQCAALAGQVRLQQFLSSSDLPMLQLAQLIHGVPWCVMPRCFVLASAYLHSCLWRMQSACMVMRGFPSVLAGRGAAILYLCDNQPPTAVHLYDICVCI